MDFWTLFSTLPEPIQAILLGGAGDFLGGVASEISTRLFDSIGYRAKKRFQLEPQQVAVNKAVAQALYETLSQFTGEEDTLVHYISIFGEWTAIDAVAGELSQLIDPHSESELDLQLLTEEFEGLGYDPDYLGLNVEFEEIIRDFAQFFYNAATEQEELEGVIKIGLLRAIVEQLGDVSISSWRTAKATERIADDVGKITSLIEELVEGSKTGKDLHEAIQMAIEQGFIGQHKHLEIIASSLQKLGYDVGFDDQGAAEIGGGRLWGNQLIAPDLIAALQNEISLLRQAIIGHTPTDEEIDILETKFRTHIIQWFQDLTFQGMMRVAKAVSLPLEDVYVELRAVAEVPEDADTFSAEERRLLIDWDYKDESEKKDLLRELDALRRARWSRAIPERKSIAEAMHDGTHNAFVILGDPGSGKTTLLHYLALINAKGLEAIEKAFPKSPEITDRLPIFIPLAAFDDMRRQRPDLTLLEFLPIYYEQRRMFPGLKPLFQRALQNGKAILLFDGLDEVLDATTRNYVSSQVSALINQFAGRGMQFVISSRFVGYREAPLPGKIPHLSVMDFGQAEIETFVHQWTFAFEKALANGIESPETIRLARKLQRDLLEDVNSNPGVRKLAANPLMLTMLALMRRQVGRLPHRRIVLYERYVSTLIENWIEARTLGERKEALQILELYEVESILIPLALWLQQTKPSGTVSKRELHNTLKSIYLHRVDVNVDTSSSTQLEVADEQARRFLKEMRHMAGLIIERGHDAFGFLHLTFQEYFVGRALAQLDDKKRWEIAKNHLHDPRWREPILLCCGRLGVVENRQPQVTNFVTQILNLPDETEPQLHRKLLLALAIVSDDVNISSSLMEEIGEKVSKSVPQYVPELDKQLIEMVGRIVSNGNIDFLKFLSPVLHSTGWWSQTALCDGLSNYVHIPEILEMVLSLLEHKIGDVREAAINVLADVADSNENVLHAILRRMQISVSEREVGIKALAKYVKTNELVKNAIIGYLQFRSLYHMDVVVNSAIPLIESEPRARNGILKCLAIYDSGAPTAISEFVAKDSTFRNQIIALFDETEDKTVRKATLKALSHAVEIDESSKKIAIDALNHEDHEVREAAFDALQSLMETDLQIRSILIPLVFERSVKWQAIDSLQKIIITDDKAREEVVLRLSHKDDFTRLAAIESLAKVVRSDDVVRTAIINCLNDESSLVRQEAVRTLSSLVDEKIILDKFQEMLSSDSWEVRQEIVQSLGDATGNLLVYTWLDGSLRQLETSNDLLLNGLEILQNSLHNNDRIKQFVIDALFNEDSQIRVQAMEILLNIAETDNSVVSKIAHSLNELDSKRERYFITGRRNAIFAKLIKYSEIRNIALHWLNNDDDDSILRSYILAAFARYVDTDTEIRNILIKHLSSDDDRETYVHWIQDYSSEKIENDDELRELLFNYIINHLETENFFYEIDDSSIKTIRNLVRMDDELRQRLMSVFSSEDAFYRASRAITHNSGRILTCYIEDDAEIRDLFFSLARRKNRIFQYDVLNGLSRLVESDNEVRNLFVEYLDYGDYHSRRQALDFLAPFVESDEEISGKFLSILTNHDEEVDIREKALKALASRVPFDSNVKKQIVEGMKDPWIQIRILAIESLSIFVNTDDQVRDDIINKFYSNHWGVRAASLYALLAWSKLPETALWNSVVNWLRADIKHSKDGWLQSGGWDKINKLLSKTVGERLPKDEMLQKQLLDWLNDPSAAVRLGTVRALAHWPGGPPNEVVPLILGALRDKRGLESYPARLTAASFLINHRNIHFSHNAIDVCLEALAYGTNPWDNLEDSGKIRKQAVLVLSNLEPIYYNDEVYYALLNAMYRDDDSEVRNAAYSALVRLAGAKEMQQTS